jgi:hypothetical protein
MPNPLDKSKEEYRELLDKIRSPDSPVGIDAGYTHAIVISYLQQITERLDKLEKEIEKIKRE